MKENSRSIRCSGACTSPGTPEYGDKNGGEMPKCWISERVALATNHSIRRQLNSSGRALPSKWDDAERWIRSPVSSSYACANTQIPQPPRRPKSKSGPLGPPGHVYLSSYSPLNTGVLVPDDGLSIRYDGGTLDQNRTTTSSSVPGLFDSLSGTSGPSSSQDDKAANGAKEEALISPGVNHRDMATQMSPDGSTCSSSKGRLSFSALPFSGLTSLHQNGNPATKDEVRDVQVDKGITMMTGQFKKRGVRKMKDSTHIQDGPLPWNASEASKNTSKLQREEAKITAWENLQKANAEAAIRKLEMKLEKKRSTSMDRIQNKLRGSQMKAQAMRNLLSENHAPRLRTSSSRRAFSACKYAKVCFLCKRN